MKLWVLLRSHNDYDQYGEYFVAAYPVRPTVDQLNLILNDHDHAVHVTAGGGRRGIEDTWFNLICVEAGQAYGEQHI
jgi:hypothetical protein